MNKEAEKVLEGFWGKEKYATSEAAMQELRRRTNYQKVEDLCGKTKHTITTPALHSLTGAEKDLKSEVEDLRKRLTALQGQSGQQRGRTTARDRATGRR